MARKSSAAAAAIDPARSQKIGEQQETITVDLDDADVERERALVMDLLGREANLEQSLASIAAEYKAKLKRVKREISEAVKAATTRKKPLDVIVEEWVRGSQVFCVRADTGEVLRQRAATTGERQVSVFNEIPSADHFGAEPFGDAT